MTSELTLLVLRLAFLAVLWIFVFSIIYALRSDLFGTRASEYQRQVAAQSRRQTFAAAETASAADPATPPPVSATPPQTAAPPPATEPPRPSTPSLGVPVTASAAPRGSRSRDLTATRIHITGGPLHGREFPLGDERLTIGRAADSDLRIQDDYTSTRHAQLLNWDGQWMIQDLDSTNGTYVEGNRIVGPAPLQPGASVRIGTTTFELR